MKICHVCNLECEDEWELCPVCGADISGVTDEEEESSAEEIIINDPVVLASFEDVVDFEIVKDLLAENGIPYTSDSGDDMALKVGFGGVFCAIDIYVDAADLERATEIYEEFLNSEQEFDEEFFEEE